MYFLTNNEDYIVAASSDFLTAICSRDVCSISTLLQNKLITIDKEQNRLTIANKDLDYEYETSNMHSAFGNLNLYTLTTPSEIDKTDETSEYLEKIQASKIEKKDNEYSIPTIATLTKEVKDEPAEENTSSIENLVIPKVPETDTNENTELENTTQLPEIKVDSQDSNDNNKLLNEVKQIETQNINIPEIPDIPEIEIPKDDSIEKLANEIIETKEASANKEVESLTADTSVDTSVESLIDTSTKDELTTKIESISEATPTKKTSGLKKITKKLFPWGSKKHEEIELEDNYEIDLKSANELEEKVDNKIANKEIEDKEITLEKTVEPENLEVNNVIEEIEIPKENEIAEVTEEVLEKREDKVTENTITKDTNNILTIDDKKDIENPIVDEEDELTILKEQMNNKVETNIDNQKEELAPSTNEEQKEQPQDSSKISYKLIALQVDAIDLQDNANKLSIDSNSYKMLLGNYLDEINKYNFELENGNTSTIEMLKDAGELLSLDILTKKLDNLKVSDKRKEDTKEISLIASLLKDKANEELNKKEQVINDVIIEEDTKSTNIQEQEIAAPPVPDEIIDITSAQDLLTSISSQSVAFNPNRAADELNLPKTLILEFVEDFISQSKEHLPIIVDAYKKEDIKTIQTTAHMLKGAASNLRLDSIAENLFKIQKESNLSSSAELIKQFVSKIKGLSSEVASLEDAEDEN